MRYRLSIYTTATTTIYNYKEYSMRVVCVQSVQHTCFTVYNSYNIQTQTSLVTQEFSTTQSLNFLKNMELPPLVLDNAEANTKVVDVVSSLVVDGDRVEKVRAVFREEVELGLKFGLEKVNSSDNLF